jgi:Transposase IS116/IS110/IS902 family
MRTIENAGRALRRETGIKPGTPSRKDFVTALAFRATIGRPDRFAKSRDVGAHPGLPPRRYQFGESRGMARARVAARQLAVILQRIWADGAPPGIPPLQEWLLLPACPCRMIRAQRAKIAANMSNMAASPTCDRIPRRAIGIRDGADLHHHLPAMADDLSRRLK